MLLWFDGNVQVLAGASLYALCNVGQEALLGGIRCLRSQYAAPVRLWQTAKATAAPAVTTRRALQRIMARP